MIVTSSGDKDDTNGYKISKEDVIFLDSRYGKEKDTRESVEEIAKDNISSKMVVISTAVMDNGVSFHDLGLRNIVILADTKETFVQMLGRKRQDGCKVKLYICKQNVEHFEKRERHCERVLECCRGYIDKLGYIKECTYEKIKGEISNQRRDTNMYNIPSIDYQGCLANQQAILDEFLTNYISSRYIREFCYSVNGLLIPNMFSIERYWDLKIFYKDIIKRLECDEYAFVRKQAEWLDIPEEKVESVIQYSQKSDYEKNREILEQAIEKVLDKSMSKKENIDWKVSIKDVLLYFIKMEGELKENDKEAIEKNDRPLAKKMFERCAKQAGLSYKMNVKSANKKRGTKTSYTVSREGQAQEGVESKD